MCDNNGLALHAAAIADVLDLGVDEQIGVAALQLALAKRLDLLVQQSGDSRHLTLEIRSPRLSTSWSTRLVETPQT
jgi:hypothetical protein